MKKYYSDKLYKEYIKVWKSNILFWVRLDEKYHCIAIKKNSTYNANNTQYTYPTFSPISKDDFYSTFDKHKMIINDFIKNMKY